MSSLLLVFQYCRFRWACNSTLTGKVTKTWHDNGSQYAKGGFQAARAVPPIGVLLTIPIRIVIDDGLAIGATMIAALHAGRAKILPNWYALFRWRQQTTWHVRSSMPTR
jgi:hypothetical protein